MKIKTVLNIGTQDIPEGPVDAGSVVEVPDAIGWRLVKSGAAEEADKPAKPAPKPKKVEAVPSKPTIGQAKETTTKSND